LGNLGAERLIAARVFEKINDFLQLVLGLITTRHIGKFHTGILVDQHPSAGFTKTQDRFSRRSNSPA